jgi:hypothetical protein
MIISKGCPYLGLYNGKAVVSVKCSGQQTWHVGTTTLQTGYWYHLAGVVEADGSLRIYVNGVEEGTTGSIDVNAMEELSGNLFVGRHSSAAYYFNGVIDNVRIYHRGLTANEIQLLYQNWE